MKKTLQVTIFLAIAFLLLAAPNQSVAGEGTVFIPPTDTISLVGKVVTFAENHKGAEIQNVYFSTILSASSHNMSRCHMEVFYIFEVNFGAFPIKKLIFIADSMSHRWEFEYFIPTDDGEVRKTMPIKIISVD